jgi:hypothetical protein
MIIAGTLRGSADPRREKPSLFFILCDELGWRDSRCFVSTFHETLNIDLATLSLYLLVASSAPGPRAGCF